MTEPRKTADGDWHVLVRLDGFDQNVTRPTKGEVEAFRDKLLAAYGRRRRTGR